MRRGRAVSWISSVLDTLRSSPRRVWWTSFVLVTLASGLWVLANPPLAGPDEPAHVIRAVRYDHGQLTGMELTEREEKLASGTGRKDLLVVRVPKLYAVASMTTTCFAYHPPMTTAACLRFGRSSRDADVLTYVARHPPAYYAAVGVVSRIFPPGSGAVYLMRFVSSLMAGAFIATAIAAIRRYAAPRLVAVGLAIAITPMVLFMSSQVNPSGLEIAASHAVSVCGLLLVSHADEGIDNRLLTAVGIAGCVLALTRQLGPLWLGLIALTIVGVSKRAAGNLVRSNWACLWSVLVVISCLAQAGWNLTEHSLDVTR